MILFRFPGPALSQDRPSPLPSKYSIVSSRAGSLPACLNVTDDSEPSVWFSLEGLTENTSPSQCVSVYGVRQADLKMAAHVGDLGTAKIRVGIDTDIGRKLCRRRWIGGWLLADEIAHRRREPGHDRGRGGKPIPRDHAELDKIRERRTECLRRTAWCRVGQHDDPHPGGRNHRVMGPGPQCESTAASFISVSINKYRANVGSPLTFRITRIGRTRRNIEGS